VIVADSSVWIENLRNEQSTEVTLLRQSLDEILMGDLILVEILQGARDDAQARELRALFRDFDVVTICGEDIAVQAARNYRTLRAMGITVRRTIDAIIATFCIENGFPLLHRDRDFGHFETHLGLRVVR
jgi:predicted nucleic acid-binding protein